AERLRGARRTAQDRERPEEIFRRVVEALEDRVEHVLLRLDRPRVEAARGEELEGERVAPGGGDDPRHVPRIEGGPAGGEQLRGRCLVEAVEPEFEDAAPRDIRRLEERRLGARRDEDLRIRRTRRSSARPKNVRLGTAAGLVGSGRGSSTTSKVRICWTATASLRPARRSASIASVPTTVRRPSGPDSSTVRDRACSRIRREISWPAGVSSYTLRRERAFATWAIRSWTFPVDLSRFSSRATWARLNDRAVAIPSWVMSTGHSYDSACRRNPERWTRIRSPTVTLGNPSAPPRRITKGRYL